MAGLKSVKVLYVEDEEEVRNSVSRVLTRRARSVVSAKNGQEGLELFQKEHPDIVITDLEMPIMNGMVMIEKIRQISGNDYPIIVITAYRDDEHYTPLADAYIYKPISFEELEKVIIELIQKHADKE